MAAALTPTQVLGFRVRAQQLDRDAGTLPDTAVLDIGVQDTGPDGSLWALTIRGVDVSGPVDDDLTVAWTIRGAPHAYRRADLAAVAAAVEPYSDADAGKRIFDASKPLKAAGITNLDALDAVAAAMRRIVRASMVKGEVSTRLTEVLDEPYLRFCRPCDTTHLYEQTFRLSALRAGLELEPGTSPPVLRPVRGLRPAGSVPDRFDLVRAYLRLLGPATPKQAAAYIDAPVRDVTDRWPDDAVKVDVGGETRWVLADEAARLDSEASRGTRLLGPFDLLLQAQDRSTLVPGAEHAKALWPRLGRPGAVLVDSELVGTWRPRTKGRRLTVLVDPWTRVAARTRAAIGEQAERLAAFRAVKLAEVQLAG